MMEIQCGDFDNGSLKSDDKFSQRKSKKPLMEKRRRARINNCLLQLKSLVLQAMKKDTSHYSKLEKADILEMTVKHLRTLQRRHISSAVAADPTVAAKYNVGFSECANEVMRYLGNAQGINEDVRNRILNHLGGCMQSLNTPQMSSSMTPHHQLQPIHVQIPTPQTTDHASLFSSDRLLVQSTPSQQTPVVNVPLQKPLQSSGNHLSGNFEVVHGSAFNGQVAFFLGQSCDTPMYSIQAQTKPSTSPQTTVPLHCQQNRGSPIYRQHSETSGHYTPVSHKSHVSNAVPGYSPVLCALKEEKLWRPW